MRTCLGGRDIAQRPDDKNSVGLRGECIRWDVIGEVCCWCGSAFDDLTCMPFQFCSRRRAPLSCYPPVSLTPSFTTHYSFTLTIHDSVAHRERTWHTVNQVRRHCCDTFKQRRRAARSGVLVQPRFPVRACECCHGATTTARVQFGDIRGPGVCERRRQG
jgi:hypothetical protein